MKISVVVPVYNTKPYLSDCIQSIIGQIYKDLEILIVDVHGWIGCGMQKVCR